MTSLLPPNTSPLERRVSTVAADLERARAPLHTLWDAQRVPASMLPWLAWAVGVDHWDRRWPEQTKRDAIEGAIPIRRLRGTVWAVRRALEVLGYRDVEILEHAQQDAAWQAAGGRYIDGDWALDGARVLGGDLVDPPRVVTTHWAQYALAFNIAAAPFEARDQRRIRQRVEAAAPLRSELVALIYRYAAQWAAPITVTAPRHRVRLDFTGCRGAAVHRARQLRGCGSLSGDYVPRRLDGAWRIDGLYHLTGLKPTGMPLDQGWGTARFRVRQSGRAGLESRADNAWKLGESRVDRLDGTWRLNEVIDGHRRLDGSWPVGSAALHQVRRPRLNGARTLGASHTLASIGSTATAVVRDRRLQTEIRL